MSAVLAQQYSRRGSVRVSAVASSVQKQFRGGAASFIQSSTRNDGIGEQKSVALQAVQCFAEGLSLSVFIAFRHLHLTILPSERRFIVFVK